MKRRILVFLLALCLAAALVPVTAFAGGYTFGGGTGTKEDPWLITSREDLIDLANRLNSDVAATNYNNFNGCYFKQTADIDLTGVKWEPIGYSGGTCFSGNYDGDGHIIANAYSKEKQTLIQKVITLQPQEYLDGFSLVLFKICTSKPPHSRQPEKTITVLWAALQACAMARPSKTAWLPIPNWKAGKKTTITAPEASRATPLAVHLKTVPPKTTKSRAWLTAAVLWVK